MIAFVVALAAAVPLPLSADERADIRCVGVTAVAAKLFGDKAVTAAREFAVIVGADIMDRTGASREDVAALMLAQGKDAAAKLPPVAETSACMMRVTDRLTADAADAPLPLPTPRG